VIIEPIPDTSTAYVYLRKTQHFTQYELNIDDIIETIVDTENMFDNKQFAQRLEQFENSIVIIEKLKNMPNGELLSSAHVAQCAVECFKSLQADRHGPAAMSEIGKSPYDFVFGIDFVGWPSVAEEWITRHRVSGWPTRDVIFEVLASGFSFVPVGRSGSNTEDYEWRRSFSKAERILLNRISDTQSCLYVHFQTCVKSAMVGFSAISSFVVKNIFLWFAEEIPASSLSEYCLGEVLLALITKLMHAVVIKTIRHYFIPTFNLLEKLDSAQCKSLYKALREHRTCIRKLVKNYCYSDDLLNSKYYNSELVNDFQMFCKEFLQYHITARSIMLISVVLFKAKDKQKFIIDTKSIDLFKNGVLDVLNFDCLDDWFYFRMIEHIMITVSSDEELPPPDPVKVIAETLLIAYCVIQQCNQQKHIQNLAGSLKNIVLSDISKHIQELTKLYRESAHSPRLLDILERLSLVILECDFPDRDIYDSDIRQMLIHQRSYTQFMEMNVTE
jgi:hypothetical protein